MSQQAYHSTDRPANVGPSTNEQAVTIGPVTVTLYRVWAGGYVVTARNGRELEQVRANFYPSAQARYSSMVERYRKQYEQALADTMLGLTECDCNGYNRSSCPACRATAQRIYGGEVLS